MNGLSHSTRRISLVTRCLFLPAAVLFLALAGRAPGQAKGIVIYKESASHPDSNAKVFEYEEAQDLGQIKRFIAPGGKQLDLDPFKPNQPMPYPPQPGERIVGPAQVDAVKAELRNYRQLIERYPNSKSLLEPRAKVANEIIQRVARGEYLYKGDWLSAAQFEALQSKQLETAREQFEKSNEKRKLQEEEKRRLEIEAARRKR